MDIANRAVMQVKNECHKKDNVVKRVEEVGLKRRVQGKKVKVWQTVYLNEQLITIQ